VVVVVDIVVVVETTVVVGAAVVVEVAGAAVVPGVDELVAASPVSTGEHPIATKDRTSNRNRDRIGRDHTRRRDSGCTTGARREHFPILPGMQLQVGDIAPEFTRPDHTGALVSKKDFAGTPVVIYFYPKAFTPGCTAESCDFRDSYTAFQNAGYEILGVSPDPVDRLEAFREEHRLPFPLISDEDHSMASAYGAWGIKQNYGKEYEGLIRSTFTIDGDGRISHAWYNVRAKGHADRVESELLS